MQKPLVFVTTLGSVSVFSQEIKPGSVATAMSNMKGQTSVDYSTSILSYSLPLFSVEQDGMQLPISLNYNASGIRVDDHPGLGGLGWVIGSGAGTITRILRGVV